MKTVGIIAEYNPFHNGHQFHIEETRRITGADFVVAVMSGDFVQRGSCALLDKYARARMALECGADLVLELPVLFSSGSAGDFSSGAVSLLDKLGVVDVLSFGSECGDISLLQNAAALLAQEPPQLSAALKAGLKQGLSFPNARAAALRACLSQISKGTAQPGGPAPSRSDNPGGGNFPAGNGPATADGDIPIGSGPAAADGNFPIGSGPAAADGNFPIDSGPAAADGDIPIDADPDFLLAPNNILGIEYYSALLKRKSAITPLTVPRKGAGYLENGLSLKPEGRSFSSALALRKALRGHAAPAEAWDLISPFLPRRLHAFWQELLMQKPFLFPEDFTRELRCRLLLESSGGFEQYADVSRELSFRLQKAALSFNDWNGLCAQLNSKETTYSRISRCLCRILLSITKEELECARQNDYVPYARILGFRREAVPLLSAIKKNGSVPLISKLADSRRQLDGPALAMLEKDVLSAHLYEAVRFAKTGQPPVNEYIRRIILL